MNRLCAGPCLDGDAEFEVRGPTNTIPACSACLADTVREALIKNAQVIVKGIS